jgi:hypothetical protein
MKQRKNTGKTTKGKLKDIKKVDKNKRTESEKTQAYRIPLCTPSMY